MPVLNRNVRFGLGTKDGTPQRQGQLGDIYFLRFINLGRLNQPTIIRFIHLSHCNNLERNSPFQMFDEAIQDKQVDPWKLLQRRAYVLQPLFLRDASIT